jgi:hypothetical protein
MFKTDILSPQFKYRGSLSFDGSTHNGKKAMCSHQALYFEFWFFLGGQYVAWPSLKILGGSHQPHDGDGDNQSPIVAPPYPGAYVLRSQ